MGRCTWNVKWLREFGASMCSMSLVPDSTFLWSIITIHLFPIFIFTIILFAENKRKTGRDYRGAQKENVSDGALFFFIWIMLVELFKNNRWAHNACDAFQVSHCCHDFLYITKILLFFKSEYLQLYCRIAIKILVHRWFDRLVKPLIWVRADLVHHVPLKVENHCLLAVKLKEWEEFDDTSLCL